MKIHLQTPVKVEKGDFLVVDDVQEKGCHCGTKQYVVHLTTTAESLDNDDGKEVEVIQQTSCYL
jgi:hypothetical protein